MPCPLSSARRPVVRSTTVRRCSPQSNGRYVKGNLRSPHWMKEITSSSWHATCFSFGGVGRLALRRLGRTQGTYVPEARKTSTISLSTPGSKEVYALAAQLRPRPSGIAPVHNQVESQRERGFEATDSRGREEADRVSAATWHATCLETHVSMM